MPKNTRLMSPVASSTRTRCGRRPAPGWGGRCDTTVTPTVTGSPAGASAIEPLSWRPRPLAADGTGGRRCGRDAPACRAGARSAAPSWADSGRSGGARRAGRGCSAARARLGAADPHGLFRRRVGRGGGQGRGHGSCGGRMRRDGWWGGPVSLYRPWRPSSRCGTASRRAGHGVRDSRQTRITGYGDPYRRSRHHRFGFMSGTTRTSADLDPRRRRTLFRAWHRASARWT